MCYHDSLDEDGNTIRTYYRKGLAPYSVIISYHHRSAFENKPRPVILQEDPDTIKVLPWGLVPAWAKRPIDTVYNCRSEEAHTKATFKNALQNHCLIPSTGFFEWQHVGKEKYPYFIYLKDRKLFSIAGIYETTKDKTTGEDVTRFTMLTTAANGLMAKIHNTKLRMPVILKRESEEAWLRGAIKISELTDHIVTEEEMRAHTISKLITSRSESSDQPQVKEEFISKRKPEN